MKKNHIRSIVLVTAILAAFAACKQSSNSENPVASNSVLFTFSPGSRFLLQQTIEYDSAGGSQNEILNYEIVNYIHETFRTSTDTIGGVANTFLAMDSVFDAGDTAYLYTDSVYYSTNGGTVSMYNYLGFVLNAIQLADSASSIAPAWSVINAPGTKSWTALSNDFDFIQFKQLPDTFNLPATILLTGTNEKDSTYLLTQYDTVHANIANHTGAVNGIINCKSLSAEVWLSYSPAAIVNLSIGPYNPINPFINNNIGIGNILTRTLVKILAK